jgi:uracil-DNA glycosylase
MAALPNLELMLLVGQYAQRWHLGKDSGRDLTSTVQRWREIVARSTGPVMVPLPHPSWRNNAWIKRNPWFDAEFLPWLRERVRTTVTNPDCP